MMLNADKLAGSCRGSTMSPERGDAEHIFYCFFEVSISPISEEEQDITSNLNPRITRKYPSSFEEQNLLETVPNFVYPCPIERYEVEHFSFIASVNSGRMYGFCRRSALEGSALVLISALPWHDLMYKLLDTLHLALNDGGSNELLNCLRAVQSAPVPAGGDTLNVKLPDGTEFSATCPDRGRLPALLVNRNFTMYWSVVDDNAKLEVFAALLLERHVLVTSSRLRRFSACVQAAAELLFPLRWQRLFWPLVPQAYSDCLQSPVAFLAGCPSSVVSRLGPGDLADGCVVLDADTGQVTDPHRDLQKLPSDVVSTLKQQLKQSRDGDTVSRCFQSAVLQLLDGYRHGIRDGETGAATYDKEAFIRSQSSDRRRFLRSLTQTQMFQQFIEERLAQPSAPLALRASDQPARDALPPRPWLLSRRSRRQRLSSASHLPPPLPLSTPTVDTGSAPVSPVSRSLPNGAPAPSLMLTVRQVEDDSSSEGWEDAPSDGPMNGFCPSVGFSLMDEIDAELARRREVGDCD